MLDRLTKEDFSPLINDVFVATDQEGREFAFTLSEVDASRYRKAPRSRRMPFSLLFKGPEGVVVTQGTVPLFHPRLGDIPVPIFLVPVGRDTENGQRLIYQAVFS